MSLKNKRVVVIGGSSGIGLAVAHSAAAAGADVAVVGRNVERLKAAAKAIGKRASTHRVDFTKEAAAQRLFKDLGKVDHIVITAITSVAKPFMKSSAREFMEAFDSKLVGSLHAIHHGVPVMNKGGSITLTSGCATHKVIPGMSTYAAVNAAVEALVENLALELAPIRVNAVSPGIIVTPVFDAMPEKDRRKFFRSVGRASPVGRVGKPEEVARAFMLLLRNGYMTGTTIHCDGGIPVAFRPLF